MMRLSQIASWCDGVLLGNDVTCQRINTDTRSLQPGDLFVALRGDRFDGHDYVAAAMAGGASAALVANDVPERPVVKVADTRRALGLLAAGYAADFSLKRIAVTGNAGKTSVKEMIACMLSAEPDDPRVHATRGNFNNEIGVPLTLLALNAGHQYGVFELGASTPGEIAWTVSLVRPHVVLVTNVTGAHLEGFGSMQGIANAKAEIFSAAAPGALAIVNDNDRFADFFAERAAQHGLAVVHTGEHDGVAWQAHDVQCGASSSHFQLKCPAGDFTVTLPIPGRHQVSNALQALAAVHAVGVPVEQAIARLAGLRSVKGRMQIHPCAGGTLVDDSYNANPGSVRAAIDWLAGRPAPRVLVLGNLGELGAEAGNIHAELGEYARAAGIDAVLALGDLAALAATGFGDGARRVDSYVAAAQQARLFLEQAGTVLVKGSRSAGMDAVVTALMTEEERR